jgi:hypothetical protein
LKHAQKREDPGTGNHSQGNLEQNGDCLRGQQWGPLPRMCQRSPKDEVLPKNTQGNENGLKWGVVHVKVPRNTFDGKEYPKVGTEVKPEDTA